MLLEHNCYHGCFADLLQRIKQMTAAVETVSDENRLLRQQSGMAETDGLDLTGVRLAKVGHISSSASTMNKGSYIGYR